MAAFNKEEHKSKEEGTKWKLMCPVCQKSAEIVALRGSLNYRITCTDCGCGVNVIDITENNNE